MNGITGLRLISGGTSNIMSDIGLIFLPKSNILHPNNSFRSVFISVPMSMLMSVCVHVHGHVHVYVHVHGNVYVCFRSHVYVA